MGAGCVVMTMGKDGCLILLQGVTRIVSAPSIQSSLVKDTSGAGDCFLGAFAYYLTSNNTWNSFGGDVLLEMEKLAEAAIFACSAATLSVQKNGTQSSYPTLAMVEEMKSADVGFSC